MLIGELSKRSQMSRDTIRYYGKLGLLINVITKKQKKNSTDNNYKNYPPEALERLRQIQFLKQCGFTLQETQALLQSDVQCNVCSGLPERLADKITSIEEKIIQLTSFKAALVQIHQSCTGTCGTSNGLPDCIRIDPQNDLSSRRG